MTKQLQDVSNIESVAIQPVNLSMAAVKEMSAKWLVDMFEYVSDNPQFIVNGFRRAGITHALDDEQPAESDGDNGDESAEVISDEDFDDMEEML